MKVLLLGLVLLSTTECYKVDFLKGYLDNEQVTIACSLCWKRAEKLRLQTELSKPVTFSNEGIKLSHFHYNLFDICGCQSAWTALNNTNTTNGFRRASRHLVLVDAQGDLGLLEKFFLSSTLAITSDVSVAILQNEGILVRKVYKVRNHSELIWEDFATWHPNYGIQNYQKLYMTSRRRDFRGEFFNVTTFLEYKETVDIIHTFRKPTKDTYPKQNYGAISALMDFCNISWKFMLAGTYGFKNRSTGKYSGILGDIQDGRAEFAGTQVIFTPDRFEVVDYFGKMNDLEIVFMLRKPSVSYMSEIFALSFERNLWLAMFVLLAILALGAYVVLNVETIIEQEPPEFGTRVSDILLVSLEAVCQQGTLTAPRSNSGKLLFFVTFLSLMLMYVAFSGNIVILLQSTRPIKNVEELYKSSISCGVRTSTYIQYYMETTRDPIKYKLYKDKIGNKNDYVLEDGLKKVQQEYFAYHVETTMAYLYVSRYYTDAEACRLQLVDGYTPMKLGYLPIQKGSPYKKILGFGMARVQEHGLHQRNYNRLMMKPTCYGVDPSFKGVDLRDSREALFLFSAGFFGAIAIFTLEIALKAFKFRSCNRKKIIS